MGHNDHIDFDMLEAIDELIERGMLEEGSDLHKYAVTAAEEGLLLPAESAIYQRDFFPLLEALGDYQRDAYMANLLSKDD